MNPPLRSRLGRRDPGLALAAATLAFVLASLHQPQTAKAQRLESISLSAGSGASFGTSGNQGAAPRLSRPFFDATLRAAPLVSESFMLSVGIRAEIGPRPGFALTPRVEATRRLGKIEVRPFVGAAIFFAPFSLFGVEAGMIAAMDLGSDVRLLAGVQIDAFFWGSDLPRRSVVLMTNGLVGFELGGWG